MGITVGIIRKRRKRANNAGSVYRHPDGRWVARISAGRDQDGRRIRKTAYALSQAEAQAKLIELQARYQSGSLAITRGRVPDASDLSLRLARAT